MKTPQLLLLCLALLGLVMSAEVNIITNGDFAQNNCQQDYCIYTLNTYQNNVQGWHPDPEIQIGYGSVYSDYLTNERVLELAPNRNSCVKQLIPNLPAATYRLEFSYGARKARTFPDTQFNVQFNGQVLKTIQPSDYQIHTESIQFCLQKGWEWAELKFCGIGGDDNSFGAFIKGIGLFKKSYGSLKIDIPKLQFPSSPPLHYSDIKPQVTPPPIQINIKKNPQVLTINSHSNQCAQKTYTLNAGYHEINFDYQAFFIGHVQKSYINVIWNGQVIETIYPEDNQIHHYTFEVYAEAGANSLSFCPAGCIGQVYHHAIISNICVDYKPCLGKKYEDLIVNGGFEQNACGGNFCIWNQHNIQANSIPGWIPNNEIEIGKGNVYNNAIGTSWVAELDPNANSCITQKLSLKTGRHTLNFIYAARLNVLSASNTFSVNINGQTLQTYTPTDYNVHTVSIEFTLSNVPAESELSFCAGGKSDSFGAVIDNVKLFFLDECLHTQPW